MKVHFSDFFEIKAELLDEYGAFDPSLINDLPLFIDPFWLFTSSKQEYQYLHKEIIKYIAFLRDISVQEGISDGLLEAWFMFPEVRQNWLGYSRSGNGGSGLGKGFAKSLNNNLHTVFHNFGSETITESSHLEKLCLIKEGVGKDNISDFITNIIKKYLLTYTQKISRKLIEPKFIQEHLINKVSFNYKIRAWKSEVFSLPTINNDYVILIPKDILTKDDTWINKKDMVVKFERICLSIPNSQLRAQLNQYFLRALPPYKPKQSDKHKAASTAIQECPEYIDYYIKYKEETGNEAQEVSSQKVIQIEEIFKIKVKNLIDRLIENSTFYANDSNTFEESYQRVIYLKKVIEDNDGYRLFYLEGKPIKKESDLQLLFRLTWYATKSDVNSEVNNGRGPVDYKISRGFKDKTLVEFKLASNSKLKQNLKKQLQVYEKANGTKKSIKVIMFFSETELLRIYKILKELDMEINRTLVLIDARSDNKPSGSNAK